MKLRTFLLSCLLISLTVPQHVFARYDDSKKLFELAASKAVGDAIETYNASEKGIKAKASFFKVLHEAVKNRHIAALADHIAKIDLDVFYMPSDCYDGVRRSDLDREIFGLDNKRRTLECVWHLRALKYVVTSLDQIRDAGELDRRQFSEFDAFGVAVLVHFAPQLALKKLELDYERTHRPRLLFEAFKETLIDVDLNILNVEGASLEASLAPLKDGSLERLRLESVTSGAVAFVKTFLPTLKHLKCFDMWGGHVPDNVADILAALHSETIEEIYLNGNGLQYRIADCLPVLARMPALRVLDLEHNDVIGMPLTYRDSGRFDYCLKDSSVQLRGVKVLKFATNFPCSSGILQTYGKSGKRGDGVALFQIFLNHFPNLEELDLENSAFDDDEMRGIARFLPKSLRVLNLKRHGFSEATKEFVRSRLPEAQISF